MTIPLRILTKLLSWNAEMTLMSPTIGETQ